MTDYFALACSIVREQFAVPIDASKATDGGHRGKESPAPNPPTEPYSIYPRDEGDQEQDFFEQSDDAVFGIDVPDDDEFLSTGGILPPP